jgi:hypothetical protein
VELEDQALAAIVLQAHQVLLLHLVLLHLYLHQAVVVAVVIVETAVPVETKLLQLHLQAQHKLLLVVLT